MVEITSLRLINLILALLLVIGCIIPKSIGCSCPFPSVSRTDTIRESCSNSRFVYRATVNDIYCKCTISDNSFSCIQFSQDGSSAVEANAQNTYTCANNGRIPSSYDTCNSVATRVGVDLANLDAMANPVQSINCDMISVFNDTVWDGCALHYQPCYYTITVDEVFKGNNYQVGQEVNVSGPDVLTSCGQYRRVLDAGTSYIVGIGGPCYPISDWTKVDNYQSNEIELLARCSGVSITVTNTMMMILILLTASLILL